MMHNIPHTEEAKRKIAQAMRDIPLDIVYTDKGCELWDKCLLCPVKPDCIDMDNRLTAKTRNLIRQIASSLRSGNISGRVNQYLHAIDCVKEWRITIDRKN